MFARLDGAAATAQGSTLPQSDFDITATSVNVEKIGTFMRITEEMLADTPQLSSYLSARVPGKVLAIEDDEILNGDGSTPNLDGLFTDGAAFVTGASGAFYHAVESANEISKGNFDSKVSEIDQFEEIKVLITSYNKMIGEIENKQNQLIAKSVEDEEKRLFIEANE